MPIDLYYVPGAAPSRSVLLAARALGVDLNLIRTNVMNGENLTPKYLKLNPQHTVPTLNDNGFALWESRAIVTYLANQYGKDDSLYPKDPKKRAVVDQRLYFDIGTLYNSFYSYYIRMIFWGESADPAKFDKIIKAFEFLDKFIGNNDFAAGNSLTLADLALVATVSTFEIMEFDISPYKNVVRWYAKVKATAPGYEELNTKNLLEFKALVDQLTKK
ncbi:glutathione S-transferase D1-like [Diorhabda carinulata]|uniref:glutathione S-transferase D1-like n=1 Tax=Diorhabda carinulata TaxID=1163345 RepID=UPI0025A06533|nr:glutathione S-transferase D1-like [Diorhabda carinulata]